MGRKNVKIEIQVWMEVAINGFQRQPIKITVQGEIEKILRM